MTYYEIEQFVATGTPWEPLAMALKYTVCNKPNVEIQILYLECQWKPHISIILCNAGLMKHIDFGIKCI